MTWRRVGKLPTLRRPYTAINSMFYGRYFATNIIKQTDFSKFRVQKVLKQTLKTLFQHFLQGKSAEKKILNHIFSTAFRV